jgi:hypothetical protein
VPDQQSSFANAEAEIRHYFVETMGRSFSNVSVFVDNQRADPPDPLMGTAISSPEDMQVGSWTRMTVLWSPSRQADMSESPRVRTPGTVVVQIFVPAGRGNGIALAIADEVALMFQRIRLDGMTFRTAYPRRVGPDGKWWQLNVVVPFVYDAIDTAK